MLVITLGTYLRAAYDYVGLNVLRLLHAAPEVHKSIIQNAMLHFLFLNGLIVALVWAALPALREWANAKYIAELNRADKSKR